MERVENAGDTCSLIFGGSKQTLGELILGATSAKAVWILGTRVSQNLESILVAEGLSGILEIPVPRAMEDFNSCAMKVAAEENFRCFKGWWSLTPKALIRCFKFSTEEVLWELWQPRNIIVGGVKKTFSHDFRMGVWGLLYWSVDLLYWQGDLWLFYVQPPKRLDILYLLNIKTVK